MLSDLPRNQFYKRYQDELLPLVEASIIDWTTANLFEQEADRIEVSYVLRDSLAGVLVASAKIVGGMDWAIFVSPIVRRFIHDEPIEEYRNE